MTKLKRKFYPDNMYRSAHLTFVYVDESGYEWQFANWGEGIEPIGRCDRENPCYGILYAVAKEVGIPVHPKWSQDSVVSYEGQNG